VLAEKTVIDSPTSAATPLHRRRRRCAGSNIRNSHTTLEPTMKRTFRIQLRPLDRAAGVRLAGGVHHRFLCRRRPRSPAINPNGTGTTATILRSTAARASSSSPKRRPRRNVDLADRVLRPRATRRSGPAGQGLLRRLHRRAEHVRRAGGHETHGRFLRRIDTAARTIEEDRARRL